MFKCESLRNIIRIGLDPIKATKHPLWTHDAEELLLMIIAHESRNGKYLRQFDNGPARGICQVEIDTMDDNYRNFINARHDLAVQIRAISGVWGPSREHLEYNPIYNVIHARLKLYRSPGQLPAAHDVQGMALYAKKFFNSPTGKATVEDYILGYSKMVMAV
jgi:hypothetical protein